MTASLSLREYGANHGSHSHEHFQVLMGLEGVLELEIEGRGQRVGAGTGALVAPGERHDFESVAGSRCLVLDSSDELWDRCAATPARPAQAQTLANFLSLALRHPQPIAALYGPAMLLECWLPDDGALQRPRRAIDWHALGDWVRSRLAEPLTAADLAARACLSPSQFSLRCRETWGMSPIQWLRGQRLARARQLRDAGISVADAACRSGYRSPSALTAALRRTGV